MKTKQKADLFYQIAGMAIAAGREIILADEDFRSEGDTLQGLISSSRSHSRRLSLTVYPPESDSREEEGEE